jgi:hypothetical protein
MTGRANGPKDRGTVNMPIDREKFHASKEFREQTTISFSRSTVLHRVNETLRESKIRKHEEKGNELDKTLNSPE